MLIRAFLTLLLILSPANASELDDALKSQDKVFLYLYAKDCGYCVAFNPYYEKLVKLYDGKHCKFLKVDAMTKEGMQLGRSVGAYYLPYVIMFDNNKRVVKNVVPKCLLNYACVKDATDKFVY